MKFRLSAHALEEMQRRSIPLAVVESVLNHPEQTLSEKDGRKAYQSRVEFDGKTFLVRAIVADDIDPAVVVTVYRTTRIEKYWRQP